MQIFARSGARARRRTANGVSRTSEPSAPDEEKGASETFVTDGPHMSRPIELEYDTVWNGDRGHLEITDARLGER